MDQTAASAGPSERVRAAQIARDVALLNPGVVRLDAGPTGLFSTVGGGTRVPGVTSAAVGRDGGYDLALRLVCGFVALPPLATAVRRSIESAAGREGITVATVTIEIVDLALPETVEVA